MRILSFCILMMVSTCILGQNCPDGYYSTSWIKSDVIVYACVARKPGLGIQRVFYGVKNRTNDELNVKFTKVVVTTCGKVLRGAASTYLKPNAFVGSGAFAGEITFETQVWAEDCNDKNDRIKSVSFENLEIENISQKQRDKDAKEKQQQADKEKQQREAQQTKPQQSSTAKSSGSSTPSSQTGKTNLTEKKTETTSGSASKSNASTTSKAKDKSTSSTPSSPPPDPRILELNRRYDEQNKQDKTEDAAMGTVAAAAGAAMLKFSDKESERGIDDEDMDTYLKAVVGLGFLDFPVSFDAVYSGTTAMSTERGSGYVYAEASLLFAAFNGSFISFKLYPQISYGMNALSKGTTGNHLTYGGGATIGFGHGFKLLANGAFTKRTGTMSFDDIVNFNDAKGFADYSYSTLKYGPGIQLRIGGDEYQLSAFKENISFLKNRKADVYSYQFKMLSNLAHFTVGYAPNYPHAGKISYPGTYQKSEEYLMRIAIAIPLTLFYN